MQTINKDKRMRSIVIHKGVFIWRMRLVSGWWSAYAGIDGCLAMTGETESLAIALVERLIDKLSHDEWLQLRQEQSAYIAAMRGKNHSRKPANDNEGF